MAESPEEPRGTTRRSVLKKAAAAGAIVWAAPAIESVTSAAAAGSLVLPTAYVYGTAIIGGALYSAYVTVTVTKTGFSCSNLAPGTTVCASCQKTGTTQQTAIPCTSIFGYAVTNGVLTVTTGLAVPQVVGSFMTCNGRCLRPTGANGAIVFNCATPGAVCA